MSAIAPSTGAPPDVWRFLLLLHEPRDVFEIRIPKHGKFRLTASGYFDDVDAATAAVAHWDGKANVYVTLNSVNPDLLTRAVNRIVDRVDATTADADVLRRRWLFIDIDAQRPSGISSTGEELAASWQLLEALAEFLSAAGWPEPVTCMSGNGTYALYRIELPNDAEATALVKQVLESLAAQFNTAAAHVDTTVSNAARIIAVVGTKKMKGDSTEDRPHRRSCVMSAPEHLAVVSRAQLGEVACAPAANAQRPALLVVPRSGGRLTDMLDAAGIAYREQAPDANAVTWYHVERCPFHDDGPPFECGVGQKLPDGAYAGHCFHQRGDGRGWHDFKRALGLDVGGVARNSQDPVIALGAEEPLTDAGNGEYFARMYGDRVRYDHRRRRWLMWDRHRWSDDADGEIHRLAKLAVRHRLLSATKIEDLTRRGQAAKFAIQSEHRQRLDALLAQAQTEPPITDAGRHWDRDPLLFGTENGILDLRAGRLRDGRSEDRITLHAPIAYNPDAACPRWLRFLDEVFGDDVELIDFIQRAVGYSLTGLTTEQCLFVCYGTGANGKSVLLRILRMLAGFYAFNAPFSLFEMHSRSAIPNDLAALVNRRLVTSSETNEGTRLNEARVKALTGCDPITARFMRAEFFTFEPVAKYWLAVNHKPSVADDSHGFWRRVRLIPFTRRFTGSAADQSLADTLQLELPGILAWAVRGVQAWQERGLRAPAAVEAATETYRLESDPLAAFIEERCVVVEGTSMVASAAFKAYLTWSSEQGMRERELLTATKFGTRMAERFGKKHSSSGNHYLDIGLLSDLSEPLRQAVGGHQGDLAPEMKGRLKGCESVGREIEVSTIEMNLTRSNPESAFTALHPFTETPREPCRGGCGVVVVAGRKCSDCAERAVAEWKQTR